MTSEDKIQVPAGSKPGAPETAHQQAPAAQQLVEEQFGKEDADRNLDSLRQALSETPRRVPTKFLYDRRGSELFEEITVLDEYYQTRTEERLLRDLADTFVARTQPRELVELGSGAATKTRVLLDAMKRADSLQKYVPLDVSRDIVHRIAEELSTEYPGLEIHAMIGDFVHDLDHLPDGDQRLIIFLGGTLGNFYPEEAHRFLTRLQQLSAPGDHLLIGVDLIKDPARIEAAYNDSRGITAEFNRNILRVVNQAADGNFDPDLFEHRAPYNPEKHRIEMWLRATQAQKVRLEAIDLDLEIAKGEEILTEISTKYDREKLGHLFVASGLEKIAWYTDPEDLFGIALARKPVG